MPRANSTAPAVNVKESEKAYTMELAAPGIKKEYCRVSINDEGKLTIAIENKAEHKHEDKHHHYLRREFSYSNYEQNYTLPDDVVKDQISAKVEDGILTITMPKAEQKQKVTSPDLQCKPGLLLGLYVVWHGVNQASGHGSNSSSSSTQGCCS